MSDYLGWLWVGEMLEMGGTAGQRDSKSMMDGGKIETDMYRLGVACSGLGGVTRSCVCKRNRTGGREALSSNKNMK
jgi:hypothetical protein